MRTINTSQKNYTFLYSFTFDGGAIGTFEAPFTLPGGVLIQLVSFKVISGLTSAGAATISLGTGTGANKSNWISSAALTNFSTGDTSIAGTSGPAIIASGGEKPSFTIEAFALTAGVININCLYIEY